MTLFPLPGPPVITITDLVSARRAVSTACSHHVDGHELLIQQDKLLSSSDLLGCRPQQLPRGCNTRPEKLIRIGCTGDLAVESGPQEVLEGSTVSSGEQSAGRTLWVATQRLLHGGARIVQVRRAGHRVGLVMEDLGEVSQVVAVVTDLGDGMKPRTTRGTCDGHQLAGLVVESGIAPLLQFDDDVGRVTGPGMSAGEDHVGALAGQREAVLQHDLHVPEPGVQKILGQDGQTA